MAVGSIGLVLVSDNGIDLVELKGGIANGFLNLAWIGKVKINALETKQRTQLVATNSECCLGAGCYGFKKGSFSLASSKAGNLLTSKTAYHRIEIAIGLLGLLLTVVPGVFPADGIEMTWASLFRWVGVALLGQGLVRDLVMIGFYRNRLKGGGKKRGLLICLESTLGVGLIGLYFLVEALGGDKSAVFSPRWLVLIFSCVWLFGFATRDLVLEMRRDPNHLNLIFGWPTKEKGS